MTEIKLSNLSNEEKFIIMEKVNTDKAGHGFLYIGKYYVLGYRPIKNSLIDKCDGVELIIRKSECNNSSYTPPNVQILFKQSWLSTKESFKDRLDKAIKTQTIHVKSLEKGIDDAIARKAKEKLDREQAIKDYSDNVLSCQLKIDSTIKTLAPNAKSMIEYNSERLLAEKAAEEATPVTDIKIEKNPSDFLSHTGKIPEKQYEKKVECFPKENYITEKERQVAINDTILNKKGICSKPKKGIYTGPPKTNEFEKVFTNFPEVKKSTSDTITVIEAELIMPEDPKYMTDLEKQQSLQNRDAPTLLNPNSVGQN